MTSKERKLPTRSKLVQNIEHFGGWLCDVREQNIKKFKPKMVGLAKSVSYPDVTGLLDIPRKSLCFLIF